MAWAVMLSGEVRDRRVREWVEPGWLVRALPGAALNARWRSVNWSVDRSEAMKFASKDEADAVVSALMPTGYVCEVVEVPEEDA